MMYPTTVDSGISDFAGGIVAGLLFVAIGPIAIYMIYLFLALFMGEATQFMWKRGWARPAKVFALSRFLAILDGFIIWMVASTPPLTPWFGAGIISVAIAVQVAWWLWSRHRATAIE